MPTTAREVLNGLRWRKGESLHEAELHVLDRRAPGRFRVVPGREVTALGHRTFDTARATIPYYKIARIEYRGRVIFERKEG